MEEKEQMEMLGALYDIAKERAEKEGKDMTEISVSLDDVVQRINDKRLR